MCDFELFCCNIVGLWSGFVRCIAWWVWNNC